MSNTTDITVRVNARPSQRFSELEAGAVFYGHHELYMKLDRVLQTPVITAFEGTASKFNAVSLERCGRAVFFTESQLVELIPAVTIDLRDNA